MISRRARFAIGGTFFALLIGYVASWFFLAELGLAGPMANLRYFYYGEYHGRSDKALYVLYYPPYWAEQRFFGGSRYGIHWTDREERASPTARDLVEYGWSDDELRNIGFSEEEIRKAHEKP